MMAGEMTTLPRWLRGMISTSEISETETQGEGKKENVTILAK
jgi:hypothetical protein